MLTRLERYFRSLGCTREFLPVVYTSELFSWFCQFLLTFSFSTESILSVSSLYNWHNFVKRRLFLCYLFVVWINTTLKRWFLSTFIDRWLWNITYACNLLEASDFTWACNSWVNWGTKIFHVMWQTGKNLVIVLKRDNAHAAFAFIDDVFI